MSGNRVHVTLISKPQCHLCEEARTVLQESLARLTSEGVLTEYEELNMLDDAELAAKYQEDIPVVLLDGRRHSYWRVDPDRFEAAVRKRARRGFRGIFTRNTP